MGIATVRCQRQVPHAMKLKWKYEPHTVAVWSAVNPEMPPYMIPQWKAQDGRYSFCLRRHVIGSLMMKERYAFFLFKSVDNGPITSIGMRRTKLGAMRLASKWLHGQTIAALAKS